MRYALLAAAVATVAGANAAHAQSALFPGPAYVLQDLNPNGGDISSAYAINNLGQMAGAIFPAGNAQFYTFQAAIFTRTGLTSPIGTLPGLPQTIVAGINDLQQAVGTSTNSTEHADGVAHATLFANGHAIDLGLLPGGSNSGAGAINNQGQAVGYADTVVNGVGSSHGALFANGVVTDLGTLPNSPSASASAINNLGVAVGVNTDVNGHEHAVVFQGGKVVDLGVMPGGTVSLANGINDSGVIVGYADDKNGGHPVKFAGGKIVDLGSLPGGNGGTATAINNAGDAVGGFFTASGFEHAVLYSNGKVIDLGTLPGFPISFALGINDLGQIVGWVSDATVLNRHAVLWLPAHQFIPPLGPSPHSLGGMTALSVSR